VLEPALRWRSAAAMAEALVEAANAIWGQVPGQEQLASLVASVAGADISRSREPAEVPQSETSQAALTSTLSAAGAPFRAPKNAVPSRTRPSVWVALVVAASLTGTLMTLLFLLSRQRPHDLHTEVARMASLTSTEGERRAALAALGGAGQKALPDGGTIAGLPAPRVQTMIDVGAVRRATSSPEPARRRKLPSMTARPKSPPKTGGASAQGGRIASGRPELPQRSSTIDGDNPASASGVVSAPGSNGEVFGQQLAAAEALFDEGKELLQRGKFEQACERFEQSQAIEVGIGTSLYLGDCYEKSGRLASAWAAFRKAASQAQATNQQERATIAQHRAAQIEPNLSKITLVIAPQPRGIQIRMDDMTIAPSLSNVPLPVDPGEHQIVARAPGFQSWSTRVLIAQTSKQLTIEVPALHPMPERSP
jgi:hypothetical protein